jgi:hypothetical protein
VSKFSNLGEPEKTTGPSGVIPIAVLKEEFTIIDLLLPCIYLLLLETYYFKKFQKNK